MVTSKNQSMFSQASETTVSLSKDVYASYSVLDGVRYVKSLLNLDTNESGEYHRVLNTKEQNTIGKIWICEDHLGIRFVKFLPPTTSSSTSPVAKGWWRDISPSRQSENVPRHEFSAIRIESDGIKLRDITDAFDGDTRRKKHHFTWPSPDYPSNRADLLHECLMQGSHLDWKVRMTYFDCNAPGVTGYTMVSQGHWISTIHAHGQGDDAEFYKEVDACFSGQAVVYMPVDQGEYVTDLQRRWKRRAFDLAFKTNRGRHAVFGPEKEPCPTLFEDTILRLPQKGTRIYFNKVGPENEPCVRYIACDEAFELFRQPFKLRRSLPANASCGPLTFDKNPWFASRCDLKGVKEVTLCRDVSLSHKPVTGMLVEDTDGHRECLGQFRFDKVLETIQADRSGGLYIGLQRMPDSTHVADVRGFPPGVSLYPKNVSWIEMPWSGELEWKFRQADCTVMHIPAVDRASLDE